MHGDRLSAESILIPSSQSAGLTIGWVFRSFDGSGPNVTTTRWFLPSSDLLLK
jgi:hypothetical protein